VGIYQCFGLWSVLILILILGLIISTQIASSILWIFFQNWNQNRPQNPVYPGSSFDFSNLLLFWRALDMLLVWGDKTSIFGICIDRPNQIWFGTGLAWDYFLKHMEPRVLCTGRHTHSAQQQIEISTGCNWSWAALVRVWDDGSRLFFLWHITGPMSSPFYIGYACIWLQDWLTIHVIFIFQYIRLATRPGWTGTRVDTFTFFLVWFSKWEKKLCFLVVILSPKNVRFELRDPSLV
jgi:hypothetical protein